MLVTMSIEVGHLKGTVEELKSKIDGLEMHRQDELALCPFHPLRKDNGGDIIDRVARVEQEIGEARAFVRGLFVLGGANLATLITFLVLPWLQSVLGG